MTATDGDAERAESALKWFNFIMACCPEKIYECEPSRTIRTALQSTRKPPVQEVTHEQMIERFSPSPVFKEAFSEIVEWINCNYPNGVKIV